MHNSNAQGLCTYGFPIKLQYFVYMYLSFHTGTFNNLTHLQNTGECSSCVGGMYCETPGLTLPTGDCNAGYYCPGGSNTSTPLSLSGSMGDTCTLGHYCPAGTANPLACAPGTYADRTGL